MRAINIVDGQTIFTEPAPVTDMTLLQTLRRSIELLKKDKRWMHVNDRTPVIWEDQLTEWGSLSQNEKQACDFNAEGLLEGGNPFDSMNDMEAP